MHSGHGLLEEGGKRKRRTARLLWQRQWWMKRSGGPSVWMTNEPDVDSIGALERTARCVDRSRGTDFSTSWLLLLYASLVLATSTTLLWSLLSALCNALCLRTRLVNELRPDDTHARTCNRKKALLLTKCWLIRMVKFAFSVELLCGRGCWLKLAY